MTTTQYHNGHVFTDGSSKGAAGKVGVGFLIIMQNNTRTEKSLVTRETSTKQNYNPY